MPWAALLFLAIDAWLATRRPAWCLVGMLAVAMQVLAGHPQYVYITALAAGCYSIARLAEPRERRPGAAVGLLSFYAGGALLAAPQLVAGFEATAETIRGKGLPLLFAGSFSFPPENFVTLIVPGFFGDTLGHPYWGRWSCGRPARTWGSAAWLSPRTAPQEGAGADRAPHHVRSLRAPRLGPIHPAVPRAVRVAAVLRSLPREREIRLPAALVLAVLAAHGLDRVLREGVSRRALWVGAAAALVIVAAAAVVRSLDWRPFTQAMLANPESYVDRSLAGSGDSRPPAGRSRFCASCSRLPHYSR